MKLLRPSVVHRTFAMNNHPSNPFADFDDRNWEEKARRDLRRWRFSYHECDDLIEEVFLAFLRNRRRINGRWKMSKRTCSLCRSAKLPPLC